MEEGAAEGEKVGNLVGVKVVGFGVE